MYLHRPSTRDTKQIKNNPSPSPSPVPDLSPPKVLWLTSALSSPLSAPSAVEVDVAPNDTVAIDPDRQIPTPTPTPTQEQHPHQNRGREQYWERWSRETEMESALTLERTPKLKSVPIPAHKRHSTSNALIIYFDSVADANAFCEHISVHLTGKCIVVSQTDNESDDQVFQVTLYTSTLFSAKKSFLCADVFVFLLNITCISTCMCLLFSHKKKEKTKSFKKRIFRKPRFPVVIDTSPPDAGANVVVVDCETKNSTPNQKQNTIIQNVRP